MAKTFQLEILTPERQVLSQEVEAVTAPGVVGGFGVLAGHAPLLSSLVAGTATYTVDGKRHALTIGGGFAEVSDGRVKLLVESATEQQGS